MENKDSFMYSKNYTMNSTIVRIIIFLISPICLKSQITISTYYYKTCKMDAKTNKRVLSKKTKSIAIFRVGEDYKNIAIISNLTEINGKFQLLKKEVYTDAGSTFIVGHIDIKGKKYIVSIDGNHQHVEIWDIKNPSHIFFNDYKIYLE